MLLRNLKNAYNSVIDYVIGPMCPSGFDHRVISTITTNPFTGRKYCLHYDCLAEDNKDNENVKVIVIDGFPIEGPTPAIEKILTTMHQLEAMNESVKALQDYNNKAFKNGCIHGMNMERSKLFNTLKDSKQLLLDTIVGIGVSEHRVPQFVDWYERVRDSKVNPRQDVITYNTCKNILELTEAMKEIQQNDVQLT